MEGRRDRSAALLPKLAFVHIVTHAGPAILLCCACGCLRATRHTLIQLLLCLQSRIHTSSVSGDCEWLNGRLDRSVQRPESGSTVRVLELDAARARAVAHAAHMADHAPDG